MSLRFIFKVCHIYLHKYDKSFVKILKRQFKEGKYWGKKGKSICKWIAQPSLLGFGCHSCVDTAITGKLVLQTLLITLWGVSINFVSEMSGYYYTPWFFFLWRFIKMFLQRFEELKTRKTARGTRRTKSR